MTSRRKGTRMNVEIAQRLAAMRREKGYSQEELANRLGLSRQAVSKWERAESSPDTGNLIALADLYGVTLDELVRVDVDISDDVRFEEADKEATAEVSADVITAAAESVAASTARAEAAAQVHELKDELKDAVAQATKDASGAQGKTPDTPQPPPPDPQTRYAPQAPDGQHASARPTHSPWATFPYPVLCVIIFLVIGFVFGWWHPGWVIFLTIPIYYWIVRVVEDDPNWRASHEEKRGEGR